MTGILGLQITIKSHLGASICVCGYLSLTSCHEIRPFGAPEADWGVHKGVHKKLYDPPPTPPRPLSARHEVNAYGWDPKLAFVKFTPSPANPQPPRLPKTLCIHNQWLCTICTPGANHPCKGGSWRCSPTPGRPQTGSRPGTGHSGISVGSVR